VQLLLDFHHAFVLEDGETDLDIDTGDAAPKHQYARRTPFATREEISTDAGAGYDLSFI